MRAFSRVFAFLFFSVFVGGAFATETCTSYQYVESGKVIAGPGPAAKVCSQVGSIMTGRETTPRCNYGTVMCTYSASYQNNSCVLTRNPGGFTQTVGLDQVSGPCGDTVCKSQQGQDFTLNWSLGYTRTPDIDADLNWKFVAPPVKPPSNGLVCDPVSSCKVALVLAPTAVWQSLSPTSQGLYRVSVVLDAPHMGETCTPTAAENAAAHPAADKPTCPGFVGEVNGVVGCYGTASSPTANDVPESKPKPPEAGNPPAGKKPDSGEGSGTGAGRTPSSGDGGPAGGPAAAAGSGSGGSGTGGDGTGTEPGEEQANCGAPGQPKCSINEAGTPDGKSAFDSANTGLDQNKDGWLAEISKVKDLTAPGWTWTFQLPSGCSPLDVPAFNLTLDVCRFQPIIHDIMSMLWAIATVMGCALMVFNATGKN